MKHCPRCDTTKHKSEFSKETKCKDGLRVRGKACERAYRQSNRESIALKKKEYWKANKETLAAKANEYQSVNRDRIKAHRRARRQHDPLFKLCDNIRTLIGNSFRRKGWKKSAKAQKILGCTFEELYEHLEQTFLDNYDRLKNDNDGVHIDHIIPLATATCEADVIRLCHYSNLQWLLAADNLKKGSRI